MSQSQADYTKYILYVVPGDPNSERAMSAAASMMDVLITNVRQMPKAQRPPWLASVPTLYDVHANKTYSGSLCVDKLASFRPATDYSGDMYAPPANERDKVALIDMGPRFPGTGSSTGYSNIMSAVTKDNVGKFIPEVGVDDERYKKDGRQKVSSAELDMYRQNRERRIPTQPQRAPVQVDFKSENFEVTF